MLTAYDPVHYGRLTLEPDMRPLSMPPPPPPQALDLAAQAGAMLKGNGLTSPLRDYAVKRLLLVGAGIGGDVTADWLSTGQADAWTSLRRRRWRCPG